MARPGSAPYFVVDHSSPQFFRKRIQDYGRSSTVQPIDGASSMAGPDLAGSEMDPRGGGTFDRTREYGGGVRDGGLGRRRSGCGRV
jgi:hypothetical protein